MFFTLLNSAAVMVYVERKVAAEIQQRIKGPWLSALDGALQPLADIMKLMFKEDRRARRRPTKSSARPRSIIAATAAFTAFAVVPFGAETTFFGWLDHPIPLQVADVNVAVLSCSAVMATMGVYGVILAGWASSTRSTSLLGGLRSSAQMISYELSRTSRSWR